MIWHSDPKYLGIAAEERWTRERERASMRRLLAVNGQRGTLSKMVRRAQVEIEQKFYNVVGNRSSPPSPEVDDVPVSDAELIRLLSLLTPEGEVLRVECVHRVPESVEEPCVSGS